MVNDVDVLFFLINLLITYFICTPFLHDHVQIIVVCISKSLSALPLNVFPQKGDNFLYLQRFNPNTLQKYRLEREEPGLSPLSFSASYKDKHIRLVYLCKPACSLEILLVSVFNSIG